MKASSANLLLANLHDQVDLHLVTSLTDVGYQLALAINSTELREQLDHPHDLLILDLLNMADLPQLHMVRSNYSGALIVLGPARDAQLLVTVLDEGADDYVTRPLRIDELLARIRAQLRRREQSMSPTPPRQLGPLWIDPEQRQVVYTGQPLDLSAEEYTLLSMLAAQPGFACPALLLLERVWGHARRHDIALLNTTVARLRELIELSPNQPTILRGNAMLGFWLNGG